MDKVLKNVIKENIEGSQNCHKFKKINIEK